MSELVNKIVVFLMGITLSVTSISVDTNKLDREKQSNPQKTIVEEVIKEEGIVKSLSITQKPVTTTTLTTGWWSYPKEIKLAKRNGNDLLVLVNKEYKLPETYAPNDLVKASLSGIRRGENYYLRNILINDLRDLVNQAKAEGVDLSIRSAYRSYSDQLTTYNFWLRVNGDNPDEADKISARAGHSQHQLGTAVDFSSAEIQDGLGGQFAGTAAAKWLELNAWKYGFVLSFPSGYESTTGYSYESWHYRYIGKTYALELHNSGKILETYLRERN